MQQLTVPRLSALLAACGLATFGLPAPVAAQATNGIVIVDVMIINDDGGALTNPEVGFIHTNDTGQQTVTSGTDDNPLKCLTSDGGMCHIGAGPIGPGSVIVDPIDGYTIDIQCVAGFPPSTASGDSFDLAASGEVFCVVMLDDIAPTSPTTTLTPTTTVAPSTTVATAPSTTVATVPPTTITLATQLPETGPEHAGPLALMALAVFLTGVAATGLSRRRG